MTWLTVLYNVAKTNPAITGHTYDCVKYNNIVYQNTSNLTICHRDVNCPFFVIANGNETKFWNDNIDFDSKKENSI